MVARRRVTSVSSKPRSRGFPRSGIRPGLEAGSPAAKRCFSEPRSRGCSLFGFSHRRTQRLKPNSEKAGEPASRMEVPLPDDPPSTAGLIPLRGKPRERGSVCADVSCQGVRLSSLTFAEAVRLESLTYVVGAWSAVHGSSAGWTSDPP